MIGSDSPPLFLSRIHCPAILVPEKPEMIQKQLFGPMHVVTVEKQCWSNILSCFSKV